VTAAPILDPALKAHATPDQARYIDAINLHGGFRRAARALGMAPSSLSQGIDRVRAKSTGERQAKALTRAAVAAQDRAPVPCVAWKKSSVYVITAAVNATPVHTPFWEALGRYAKHRGATLVVVPLRYKNPTSAWTNDQEHDDWWAPETASYLYSEGVDVAKGLRLLANVRTQPTAQNPLQGMDSITGSKSGIVAHPKLALTTVPTPQGDLPKIMTTTGACTVPAYSPTAAGAKGDFHHTIGALVVELQDGLFHLRHINAKADGSFIDLCHEYTSDSVTQAAPALALVLGDLHVDFVDPLCDKATFGPGGMVETLRPKELVMHDVLDMYAGSHHHVKDPITQYAKHMAGRGNVLHEVKRCFEYIDTRLPSDTACTIVGSNHNEHLGRWVRETDPRKDPENAIVWAELYSAMCQNARIGVSGLETIDPVTFLAKKHMISFNRVLFAGRSGRVLAGIELGLHGDRGPNGTRGSRKALSKIGVKSIIGHSHSPGIEGGCYQTGTSSRLTLEYSAGCPSSWLNTHCVVYANGKRALLHVIQGQWRGGAAAHTHKKPIQSNTSGKHVKKVRT
jgi:Bacterial regulatory helix-turn-helix protein, lysR family